MTPMTPTVFAIPGTSNLRDIGGYPAANGGKVRRGMVLRGEALVAPGFPSTAAVYDPALSASYKALGLATVIDLRGVTEAESQPNAWGTATGARVVDLPMDAGGEGDATLVMRGILEGSITHFGIPEFTNFYASMTRDLAPTLGAAITTLAEADSLPALVHCMAGKDRTGAVIALLLSVLGTPREIVATDYQYTEVLRPNRVETYRDRLTQAGVKPEDVRVLFESPAAVMHGLLDTLDAEHGSVEAYLTGPGGVDPSALAQLRATLIE
ncbi:MAG: tyrosine-protein phosphatase [Maritimibacter sp.]